MSSEFETYWIPIPKYHVRSQTNESYSNYTISLELKKWLKENKLKWIFAGPWNSYLSFANAEDAMAFKLRWC